MTDATIFKHRFGGWREADARRWTNPDGSVGGIVAVSASVAEGLTIPETAVIWPRAHVGDGAYVGAGSSVGSRARVGAGAYVGPDAHVGDGAEYTVDDWLFMAGPQGSRNAFASAIWSPKNGLLWWVGCRHGITTEILTARVKRNHGEGPHAEDYLYLIRMVEAHPGLARAKAAHAVETAKEA